MYTAILLVKNASAAFDKILNAFGTFRAQVVTENMVKIEPAVATQREIDFLKEFVKGGNFWFDFDGDLDKINESIPKLVFEDFE